MSNRGGHNFRGGPPPPGKPHSKPVRGRDLYEGLPEKPTSTLTRPVDDSGDKDIGIENLEYLGSYNWVDSKDPTIIVPGSPREWTDRELPFRVALDYGSNFIDQNAYRIGKLVLLPLVQAVETVRVDEKKPAFDWSSVDFVTDRNGLRKLLRWVIGTGTAPSNDFRIDTQLAGDKTVLFNRWERKNEVRGGRDQRSYGFNFENEATSPAAGCQDGTGHHRIVTYDFDGLKMVIRFEVDACLPSSTSKTLTKGDGEDLANMISDLTIDSTTSSSSSSASTLPLKIIRGGRIVPQSSIIEMRTRSKSSNRFSWRDHFPQLYLSQTPLHYLAMHEEGNFSVVEKAQTGEGTLVKAERDLQRGLKKLRTVLAAIHRLVKERGLEGRITLIGTEGVLKVYERSAHESCLPNNILALFDRKS